MGSTRPARRCATSGSSAGTTGDRSPCEGMYTRAHAAANACRRCCCCLPAHRWLQPIFSSGAPKGFQPSKALCNTSRLFSALLSLAPCRCPAPCHSGECAPCPLSARISCACGRTHYTVPCGREAAALPPRCSHPCPVPLLCRHAEAAEPHRCHFGPCPPCPQPCGTKVGAPLALFGLPVLLLVATCPPRHLSMHAPCRL